MTKVYFHKDDVKKMIDRFAFGSPKFSHTQSIYNLRRLWQEQHGTPLKYTKSLITRTELQKFFIEGQKLRMIKSPKYHTARFVIRDMVSKRKKEMSQKYIDAATEKKKVLEELKEKKAELLKQRREAKKNQGLTEEEKKRNIAGSKKLDEILNKKEEGIKETKKTTTKETGKSQTGIKLSPVTTTESQSSKDISTSRFFNYPKVKPDKTQATTKDKEEPEPDTLNID